MINELHQLDTSLKETGISAKNWYGEYGEIPNITQNAPCFRIVIDGTRVAEIERVTKEKRPNIRKFGNNQGSFPAMNLAALYLVTDENAKTEIARLIRDGGEFDLERIRNWCTESNWTTKFCNKYTINFETRPNDLVRLLHGGNGFEPLTELIAAVQPFKDPTALHKALEDVSMEMLSERRNIAAALQLLFHPATPKDAKNGDYGSLSVVFDTYDLEDSGFSTVGPKFAIGLNRVLLESQQANSQETPKEGKDAFGRDYTPLEKPMPKVKLAAGFDVSLRTMFKGQPCQHRYGRIENATYPITIEERTSLSAALAWLSAEERKNKTWVSLGKGEALFVFPSKMSENAPELTGLFQSSFDPLQKEAQFEAKAKDFSSYVTKTKMLDPEHYPEWIRFFVLRKLDKARTKIVYSYNARTEEIIQYSGEWQRAAKNLPAFHFCTPEIPFPLSIAGIINRVWKRDGTQLNDMHKEVNAYYGMELFFRETDLDRALRILLRNASPLASFAGGKLNSHLIIDYNKQLRPLEGTLALMGMLLFWKGSRKEEYMNEYPYLFGQLLKASDSLHELYCKIERRGDIPPQLIGSTMYQAAMDSPKQALAQLGKRLAPYLAWAKTHPYASIPKKNEKDDSSGPGAWYYLKVMGTISERLSAVLTDQTRFDDVEKGQLFIGYLASFPKSESTEPTAE